MNSLHIGIVMKTKNKKKSKISTISTKGQTTIPSAIRNFLRINPGDSIGYIIDGDEVKIKKVEEIDIEWAKAIEMTLSEWSGSEDDDL